jgi:hypothetical protein
MPSCPLVGGLCKRKKERKIERKTEREKEGRKVRTKEFQESIAFAHDFFY